MRTPVNIVRIDKRLGCPKGYFGFRVEPVSHWDAEGKNGPTAQIFDMRYPMHGEEGQLIASYYFDTLMDLWDQGRGLNLYGGEPEWQMSSRELAAMLRQIWLSRGLDFPKKDEFKTLRGWR